MFFFVLRGLGLEKFLNKLFFPVFVSNSACALGKYYKSLDWEVYVATFCFWL